MKNDNSLELVSNLNLSKSVWLEFSGNNCALVSALPAAVEIWVTEPLYNIAKWGTKNCRYRHMEFGSNTSWWKPWLYSLIVKKKNLSIFFINNCKNFVTNNILLHLFLQKKKTTFWFNSGGCPLCSFFFNNFRIKFYRILPHIINSLKFVTNISPT